MLERLCSRNTNYSFELGKYVPMSKLIGVDRDLVMFFHVNFAVGEENCWNVNTLIKGRIPNRTQNIM